MLLGEYYRGRFRADLQEVYSSSPTLPPCSNSAEPHFAPSMLGPGNGALVRMTEDVRLNFALSLYLTFLVDQVMHAHFRPHYAEFQRLTRYPKWRGECPGGCRTNIHPQGVLRVLGYGDGIGEPKLHATLPVFREVVDEFFGVHMLQPRAEEVWERMLAEPRSTRSPDEPWVD